MKLNETLALVGNTNRCDEMQADGVGYNAMSGLCKDNGIDDVSAKDLEIYHTTSKKLRTKAIPKKASKALGKQVKALNEESVLASEIVVI